MCPCQAKLRREILRALWQAHFTQWLAGDLNQREYCEANGLSLRQFGNWRAEFKYEHLVSERRVLWKRGEGVSHGLSHAASHATREKTILKPKPPRPPAVAATVAAATNFAMHRRNFSQKAKEAIVLETLKPGTTVTDVARRYQIAPRGRCSGGGQIWPSEHPTSNQTLRPYLSAARKPSRASRSRHDADPSGVKVHLALGLSLSVS